MTIPSPASPTAIPSLRDFAAPYFLPIEALENAPQPQPPNPARVNNYDTFNIFVNRAAARRKFLEGRRRADITASEGAEETVTPEKDTTPAVEKSSAEKTGRIKRGLNPDAVVFQPGVKVLGESTNVDTARHSLDCSRDHINTEAGFEKVVDWNAGAAAGWCEDDFPLSEFCKDDEVVN